MALFSTALRNEILSGNDFFSMFIDFELRIYAAASTPASAEDALPVGATLMYTFTALDFATVATDGVLPKVAEQTWTATCAADGTMRFFRCVMPPDTGAGEDATVPRIQGTIGTFNADLIVASLAKVATDPLTINVFGVTLSGDGHTGIVGGVT